MWHSLLEKKILTPVDHFFADLQAPKTEEEKAFYATLMAISREGHLCLDLEYIPLPFSEPEWAEKVRRGALMIQESSPHVRFYKNLCYLKRNFYYETQILFHLQRLSVPLPKIEVNLDSSILSQEQREAIEKALSYPVCLINGGPGSGKSFLTFHLIQAMKKSLGPATEVLLTAPTGKATIRLQLLNPETPCSTLHSLLGITSSKTWMQGKSYVEADLIIVDESSMIDARLFAFFLASLRIGQRVLFLGDKNQLPPVEPGAIFADLLHLIPTASLTHCFRSNQNEVIPLAQNILNGEIVLPHHEISDSIILHLAQCYYPQPSSKSEGSFAFDRFVFLSPFREGLFGIHQLNEKIFHFFYDKLKSNELLAVPILITKTTQISNVLKLYNGEMGILWKKKEKSLHAHFRENVILPATDLPSHQLGYVLSVHMSQGSEFDRVALILPPGSEKFGRSLLYTAVTRARLKTILIGQAEVIEKTAQHLFVRSSGLRQRWQNKSV